MHSAGELEALEEIVAVLLDSNRPRGMLLRPSAVQALWAAADRAQSAVCAWVASPEDCAKAIAHGKSCVRGNSLEASSDDSGDPVASSNCLAAARAERRAVVTILRMVAAMQPASVQPHLDLLLQVVVCLSRHLTCRSLQLCMSRPSTSHTALVQKYELPSHVASRCSTINSSDLE